MTTTRDYLIDLIVEGTDRGNDVRDWPEDEAQVHRDYLNAPRPETGRYGSFEDRNNFVNRYRAGKIADKIIAREHAAYRSGYDAGLETGQADRP